MRKCKLKWQQIGVHLEGRRKTLQRTWGGNCGYKIGSLSWLQWWFCRCMCSYMLSLFSHVRLLCDPTDHSLPGASVHAIPQARILKWVAMLSSKRSSQPGTEPMKPSPASQGGFFPRATWEALIVICVSKFTTCTL